jgi:hypothetical protein
LVANLPGGRPPVKNVLYVSMLATEKPPAANASRAH